MLDSMVHAGNTRAVGTSTRADACACACAGDPQPRLFEFTSHNGHVRQQRAQYGMMMVVYFCFGSAWSIAVHEAQSEQRSKLDIGCADAGAGGMSMISGSGGASGMGASSSSSDASAMAQSTGSSGAGSGSMCQEKGSSWAWSAVASATASLKWASLWARNGRHPVVHALFSSQKSVTARAAHSAEDWRRHALFVAKAFEGAIEDGAGKSGARLRPDAAREAAEDGHVAGLRVRSAVRRDEAQYDVRECGLHGGQGGLAGVDAGHVPEKDPRLSFFA